MLRLKYENLWNIRKGIFPAVGAIRALGTGVVIEDVAFPIENLAEATIALREILDKYAYADAIFMGMLLMGICILCLLKTLAALRIYPVMKD
nr:FAD-linked oxidase C-terminal domain-containing protein [Desulfosporosinus orientis]